MIQYDSLEKAVETITKRWPDAKPRVGAILGSGWSEIVEAFGPGESMAYEDIPGLGKPGVVGHSGRLVRVVSAGVETLIFQGRRHFYEGEGWTPIALPIYVLKKLGASVLVITNAAGGLRADLRPGTLMLIEDHINLMGANPLLGPHHAVWGPRFPDQSRIYHPDQRALALRAAEELNEGLRRGVYLGLSGPSYETPAEIRSFRGLGADAVGMSTVPEAQLANAAGLKVLGISCITNLAAGISSEALSHAEVTQTTHAVMPRMKRLFLQIWRGLASEKI